jgi:hypothetical protein
VSILSLNNREISIVAWLTIFLAWAFSKAAVRKAGVDVLRAALAWKIILGVSMMSAYIALIAFGLHTVGLWGTHDLKTTFVWALTAALAMVFNIGSVSDNDRFFQNALRDGFKISVVLEFIVNLYVFNLMVEIVLVPIITIVACMLVIAESKDEYRPIRSFLNTILVAFGLVLLAYSGYRIHTDLHAFARPSTLAEFLLPIMLTSLFLPFVYLLATIVTYENFFVRLTFFMADEGLRRFTKLQLLRQFGLNYRALNRWTRRFVHERPSTHEEVLASIRGVDTSG